MAKRLFSEIGGQEREDVYVDDVDDYSGVTPEYLEDPYGDYYSGGTPEYLDGYTLPSDYVPTVVGSDIDMDTIAPSVHPEVVVAKRRRRRKRSSDDDDITTAVITAVLVNQRQGYGRYRRKRKMYRKKYLKYKRKSRR